MLIVPLALLVGLGVMALVERRLDEPAHSRRNDADPGEREAPGHAA